MKMRSSLADTCSLKTLNNCFSVYFLSGVLVVRSKYPAGYHVSGNACFGQSE